VIGWSSSQRIDAQLACGALKAAIARRSPPHGIIMKLTVAAFTVAGSTEI